MGISMNIPSISGLYHGLISNPSVWLYHGYESLTGPAGPPSTQYTGLMIDIIHDLGSNYDVLD